MLYELKQETKGLCERLASARRHLDPSRLAQRIESLEHRAASPSLWDDPQKAQSVMQELNGLKAQQEMISRWDRATEDLSVMLELAEDDEELAAEMAQTVKSVTRELDKWELTQLLSGPYDNSPAILSVAAGAGGTDAADWAAMLLRMYGRWAEQNGYKAEMADYSENEEAGIKGATLIITGPYAYGRLVAEKGTHRLVRISPFNAAGKRQTAFAGVDVVPEIEADVDIDIDPKDLRIDTFRSGGAGGQNVNKVETAIRITHLPTGTVVACQNERSQLQNRETAMRILKAKLFDRMMAEHAAKLADLKGPQTEAAWGHQIRSYVLHPYTMVKDHRTGEETGNVQTVVDGAIDEFIDAYLRARAQGRLAEASAASDEM
ncbi:MAG: peptide chain release factor 2 [Candidatus Sericytochromatia bacterium]|nr:peptide chain release factor 2 [Candidatus Sericytochromatia bacterium]